MWRVSIVYPSSLGTEFSSSNLLLSKRCLLKEVGFSYFIVFPNAGVVNVEIAYGSGLQNGTRFGPIRRGTRPACSEGSAKGSRKGNIDHGDWGRVIPSIDEDPLPEERQRVYHRFHGPHGDG